jgi:hypothetical protein
MVGRHVTSGEQIHTAYTLADVGAAWTVAAWINLDSAALSGTVFRVVAEFDNNYGMFVHVTAGVPKVSYGSIGGGADGTTTPSASTWYHLAQTVTGQGATAGQGYLNGATDGAAWTVSGHAATTTFYAGNDNLGPPLIGSLADVAIWTVALTPTEIQGLSRGTRPSRIRPTNLWWPLDGLQSPEPDLSGNKNNATLTGTTKASGPPYMPQTRRWPQLPISMASIPTFPFQSTQFIRKPRIIGY